MPSMLCGCLDVPGQWDHIIIMTIHAINKNLRARNGKCLRASGWLVPKMNWLTERRVISGLRLLLPHSNLYNCTRCSECLDCEHPFRITPVQVGLLKLQFDALFVVSIFVDFIFFVDMFLHLGLLAEAKIYSNFMRLYARSWSNQVGR